VAASAGVWLFYVQHNFPGSYWMRHKDWDFYKAALKGSSYYQLPRVLQWFTGNIGFHHIHHLSPKVPNYNLERCYRENPEFHVPPLTLKGSLACLHLRLWDERSQQMVGWEAIRSYKLKMA
jgi:omega-6 fatty acid desaturase (delta-12 desaturase)